MKTILFALAIIVGTSTFAGNAEMLDEMLDLKLRMIAAKRTVLLYEKNQLDIELRDNLDFNPDTAAKILSVSSSLELLGSQRRALVSNNPAISPPSLSQILESLKNATNGINYTANADLFNLVTQAEIAVANGNQ